MMSLPFFAQAAALLCVWAGRRNAAFALLVLSLIVTLVLFRLHATDPLAIVL
ncbi:hypothetical protein SAMN02745172_01485 [Pseudoxanthobacter soli DSM 19599]|uniref:Uncharacterized protein n=1 Tax=Pseudoxanthobacter soli DSM 19599 TaxID=1123029 RepID=A0A1M7ZFM7_9HYPH|nr:DUF5993 family protein [Pseudoxanthobacter soli]SHO63619.1 hypothetical protein SAMN02745172_01485 [Pseudoxanthobacter soli DSM 19599]